MELIEVLKTRRSIRRFKSKPIPDQILWKILNLANAAPSAGNLQARDFVVVRDDKVKEQLAEAALGQEFVRDVPVVIVVCGNMKRSSIGYGIRGEHFYSIQDADAAVMHILLSTHALGLGTCWVGAFDDDMVSSILNLPGYIRPIAILPLGYPAEHPRTTSRLKTEKLVHIDKW